MPRDDAQRGVFARNDLARGHPAASTGSMAFERRDRLASERLEHRVAIGDGLRAKGSDDRAAKSGGARGARTDGAWLERECRAHIERAPAIHAVDCLAIAIGRWLGGHDVFRRDDHLECAVEIGKCDERVHGCTLESRDDRYPAAGDRALDEVARARHQ